METNLLMVLRQNHGRKYTPQTLKIVLEKWLYRHGIIVLCVPDLNDSECSGYTRKHAVTDANET